MEDGIGVGCSVGRLEGPSDGDGDGMLVGGRVSKHKIFTFTGVSLF